MLANNEVGTVQEVAVVADICRRHGVPLLCDAVQAAGKIGFDVASLGADYVVGGAFLWMNVASGLVLAVGFGCCARAILGDQ